MTHQPLSALSSDELATLLQQQQSAYAELMFVDRQWPDFDRRDLWDACLAYAGRERRFGTA